MKHCIRLGERRRMTRLLGAAAAIAIAATAVLPAGCGGEGGEGDSEGPLEGIVRDLVRTDETTWARFEHDEEGGADVEVWESMTETRLEVDRSETEVRAKAVSTEHIHRRIDTGKWPDSYEAAALQRGWPRTWLDRCTPLLKETDELGYPHLCSLIAQAIVKGEFHIVEHYKISFDEKVPPLDKGASAAGR